MSARAALPPARAAHIDALVARLHDSLRDDDGTLCLPIDVEQLACSSGLRVIVAEGGITGTWRQNSDGRPLSGLFLFGSGRIVVNGEDDPRRQRFTIAHELAHELLQHESRLGAVHMVYAGATGDADAAGDDQPHGLAAYGVHGHGAAAAEREADYFAGRLLVPPDELDRLVAQHGASVPVLADAFHVSAPAMRMQLAPYLPNMGRA